MVNTNGVNKIKEFKLGKPGAQGYHDYLIEMGIKEEKKMKNMNDFIRVSTKREAVDALRGKVTQAKAIKLDTVGRITVTDLMETIGNAHYTLPLVYAIENLMSSYVENDDLDEEVMDYTDEIIMSLIKNGEFVYIIRDGELYELEGVSSTGNEEVKLFIPYLPELEQASEDLLGFTRVIDNLELRDEDKSELMMQIFADDLYSFIYMYCREIWWDGGSY